MPTQTRYPRANLAACMLPWTDQFSLDTAMFEQHVQEAIDGGYKHLYLMGTAGEGYAITDSQFRDIVSRFARLTVKPGYDPQIGVISLSMGQMIERIAWARDQGIRMFQISLPSWGALDAQEILTFFKTVCGRFPDCRFLHYNLPRAKHIINGREYRRIMDEVPNLVATKNSTSDYARVADLMKHSGELQHFFLEGGFAFGSLLGECSLLCSYDALFPKTTWEFFAAGGKRDLETLFRIHVFLNEVDKVLFGHCARPMIDGSYDKTFLWLRNPRFSNRVLPPYQGLTAEESAKCRELFERHYAHIQ
ncbi:MAG: dihydrodipicolinate synthase family protein [Opitutaceae bacterium]|nr:dihydrodipicolinate synthase family protein [Opitutaceae bacterium]